MKKKKKLFHKEKLEICFNPDDSMFLNFWDWAHGNDVVAEIKGEEIWLSQFDEAANELPSKKISIFEYFRRVKEAIEKREV